MRRIRKGAEPQCLVAERAAGRGFGDIQGPCKQTMREALVQEQQSLCCYCMDRVVPTEARMVIEHLVPQADPVRGAELATTWTNLFGACDGGRGSPQHLQHCDAAKGDQLLSFSPLDGGFEGEVRYLADGSIGASSDALQRDLVEILNLNSGYLPANRSAVLDAFLDQKSRRFPGAWDRDRIDSFATKLTEGGEVQPFVGVLLYFLMKRRGLLARSR